MSRYIDAEHADFRLQCCGTYHGVIAFDTVKAVLNDAPSIDIVRCQDCIFGTEYYFKNDIQEHRHEWCYEFCDVDGYCPFGKKRSERGGE